MITQKRLKDLLDYCPESGVFTHKTTRNNAVKVGQIAGALEGRGYIGIKIDGTTYKAHRLAWLYIHGTFPENHIDHINGNRSDNRLVNLRPATNQENSANTDRQTNNTSGHKGVTRGRGKWRAVIRFNGKLHHLGMFDDPELAALSYAGAAKLLFGDFSHTTINVTINNYFSIHGDSNG